MSDSSSPRIVIRSLTRSLVTLALAAATGGACMAQTPGAHAVVRLLVGYPAGGGVDAVARHLAEGLGPVLGRTIVVENRSGAGGQIAAMALKQAAPDGQTLYLTNDHTVVTVPLTMKSPGFNPSIDFVPIGKVSQVAFGLAVHPSVPAARLDDWAQWVRSNPGKGNVGVPAAASVPEFVVGLAAQRFSMQLVPVPYRGGAPLVADLVGGQVPAGITGVSELLAYQRAGKVRVLAVSGMQRSALLADVPTFAEQSVKGLETSNFLALFAPAGTPLAVVKRYSDALRDLLATPAMRDKLDQLGMQVDYAGPEELARSMERVTENWRQVIHQVGFKPQ